MTGIEQIRTLDDRIEAAAKRERDEIEANALAVGGVVEASRNKPSGNAAALREALVGLIDGICFHCDLSGDCKGAPCEKMQKAKAALAKPPRNCNLYGGDYKMLHTKWSEWTASPSGRNPNNTMKMTFSEWLLALANEKGENDGSKQRTGAA